MGKDGKEGGMGLVGEMEVSARLRPPGRAAGPRADSSDDVTPTVYEAGEP